MTGWEVVIRDTASHGELRRAFEFERVGERHDLQRWEIARDVDGCVVRLTPVATY